MYWDDFIDLVQFLGVILCIVALLFVLIVAGSNIYGEYKCNQYEKVTNRQTQWVLLDTCYIKTDDHWLTHEEYVATVIAREGLEANK